MTESQLRERIADYGRSIFDRGLTGGSTGNISVAIDDGFLMTPTGSSLGALDPAAISKLAADGTHLSGDPPTKEAFLHIAMYRERAKTGAVVHLHSTHSVAVSCLDSIDTDDVLPPITAYYVMRIGRLPMVPFYRPGDPKLAEAIETYARHHHAVLLANHGPVVAGTSLSAAVDAVEELEETAKLYLLLRNHKTRYLTPEQVADVRDAFPIKA